MESQQSVSLRHEYVYLVHVSAEERIIIHILTIMCLISSQTARRWILSSLETAQSLMHVTHVKVTHTKEAVECASNFLFFFLSWCVGASCLTEIIMWRQHTRFASPVCSKHQMFFLTFWVELNRCLHLLGLRGRFRGRGYIIISYFKFNFSPRLRSHRTISCRHAQPIGMSIGSFLDFNPVSLLDTPTCLYRL